jgi:serine/threonine-protein kinase
VLVNSRTIEPDPTMKHDPSRLVGATLSERYRLDALCGVGGQAWVFAAADVASGESVAIKLLRPEFHQDPSTLRRFKREGEVLLGLTHRNVVRAINRGVDRIFGPWLALERLQGTPLDVCIAEGERFDARAAAELVCAVLEPLVELHRRGIAHRDIKPSNIFLAARGGDRVPTLIDFGISYRSTARYGTERITEDGEAIGTLGYMAPEATLPDRANIGQRDVWSAGVVLFELVTGGRLIDSGATTRPANQSAALCDTAAGKILALTDESFSAIVASCVAAEPNDRPPSAQALLDRLRAWLHSR